MVGTKPGFKRGDMIELAVKAARLTTEDGEMVGNHPNEAIRKETLPKRQTINAQSWYGQSSTAEELAEDIEEAAKRNDEEKGKGVEQLPTITTAEVIDVDKEQREEDSNAEEAFEVGIMAAANAAEKERMQTTILQGDAKAPIGTKLPNLRPNPYEMEARQTTNVWARCELNQGERDTEGALATMAFDLVSAMFAVDPQIQLIPRADQKPTDKIYTAKSKVTMMELVPKYVTFPRLAKIYPNGNKMYEFSFKVKLGQVRFYDYKSIEPMASILDKYNGRIDGSRISGAARVCIGFIHGKNVRCMNLQHYRNYLRTLLPQRAGVTPGFDLKAEPETYYHGARPTKTMVCKVFTSTEGAEILSNLLDQAIGNINDVIFFVPRSLPRNDFEKLIISHDTHLRTVRRIMIKGVNIDEARHLIGKGHNQTIRNYVRELHDLSGNHCALDIERVFRNGKDGANKTPDTFLFIPQSCINPNWAEAHIIGIMENILNGTSNRFHNSYRDQFAGPTEPIMSKFATYAAAVKDAPNPPQPAVQRKGQKEPNTAGRTIRTPRDSVSMATISTLEIGDIRKQLNNLMAEQNNLAKEREGRRAKREAADIAQATLLQKIQADMGAQGKDIAQLQAMQLMTSKEVKDHERDIENLKLMTVAMYRTTRNAFPESKITDLCDQKVQEMIEEIAIGQAVAKEAKDGLVGTFIRQGNFEDDTTIATTMSGTTQHDVGEEDENSAMYTEHEMTGPPSQQHQMAWRHPRRSAPSSPNRGDEVTATPTSPVSNNRYAVLGETTPQQKPKKKYKRETAGETPGGEM